MKFRVVTFILLLLLCTAFAPLFIPMVFLDRTYMFGDLFPLFGPDSASVTLQRIHSFFDPVNGSVSFEYLRYSPVFSLIMVAVNAFHGNEAAGWALMTFIAVLVGFLGMALLFRTYLATDRISNLLLYIAITLFYFLNFYSITRVVHIFMWHAFLVFPMLLFLGMEYARQLRWRYIFAYSLVLLSFMILPHGILYAGLLHVVISAHVFSRRGIISGLQFALVPIIVYLLGNVHVIWGTMLTSQEYPYRINLTQLEVLSRNASGWNTLAFANNWWLFVDEGNIFSNFTYMFSGLALSGAFLIFIFAKTINALFPQKRYRLFYYLMWWAVFGVVIFISSGYTNDWMRFFIDILTYTERLGLTAYIREWGRTAILLPILFLTGVLIVRSEDTEKVYNIIFVGVITSLAFLNIVSSPIIVPYLYRSFRAVTLPEEYVKTAEMFTTADKIAWTTPSNTVLIQESERAAWDRTKNIHMVSNSIGGRYGNPFLKRSVAAVFIEESSPSRELLDRLDIRAVIKKKDMVTDNEAVFSNYNSSDFSFTGGTYFDVADLGKKDKLKIIDNPSYLFDPSQNIATWSLLSKVLPSSRVLNTMRLQNSNLTVLDTRTGIEDLIATNAVLEKEYPVNTPYTSLLKGDFRVSWARGSTSNYLHEEFHNALKVKKIENYQDDLGLGLIYTDAAPFSLDIAAQSLEPTADWDFFRVALHKQIFDLNDDSEAAIVEGYPVFELTEKQKEWEIIKFPRFSAQRGDFYNITLQLKLENTYEPHVKLRIYAKNGAQLEEVYLKDLTQIPQGTEENIRIDWYNNIEQDEVDVEMAIFHGYDTPMPLPASVMIKRARVVNMQDFVSFPNFGTGFTVPESDSYTILARVLKSRDGGAIIFTFPQKEFQVRTIDNSAYFDWVELGETTLQPRGRYIIQSISGFNAVNALVMIPTSEYEVLKTAAANQQRSGNNYVYYSAPGIATDAMKVSLAPGTYTIHNFKNSGEITRTFSWTQTRTSGENALESPAPDVGVLAVPANVQAPQTGNVTISHRSSNKIEGTFVTTQNNALLQFGEYFSPLWKLEIKGQNSSAVIEASPLYLDANGFIIPLKGEYTFTLTLEHAEDITFIKSTSYVWFIIIVALLLLSIRELIVGMSVPRPPKSTPTAPEHNLLPTFINSGDSV
ncbi:MAG: hypothetical protein QY314_03655 [Candidatus Dojkabacteria bacterium]|nr:MAG: hypothetical protein QY314_03655 [Candidatus Dojkabacteria bacterium]